MNWFRKLFDYYLIMNWFGKLFDYYLTNLELIPYHSEGITLPSKLSSAQLDYLKFRFRANLDFITKFKPKLLLFNIFKLNVRVGVNYAVFLEHL
jgi:hypothetical protein